MSDDITTPGSTDTVDVSAPPEGHAQPGEQQIDYEQRYNSLRPEFDRTKQQLSEYEQTLEALQDPDPQVRAAALAAFGLELEDEEVDDTPEYEDPIEAVQQRLERLETERQQAEQAAAEEARQDAIADFITDEVEKLQSANGEELSDFEWRTIAHEAQRLQHESNARAPMVQEAWDAMFGVYDQRLSKAFKGKPTGRPVAGQSASKQPDLSKGSERAAYIDDQLGTFE